MDITIGKIASWFFGAMLILAGLGSLTMSIPAAIIYLLTGLFLIPNVRQEIDERYDIAFSRWVVVIIALIGIGLGGALTQGNLGSTSPTNANTGNQQPAQNTDNQDQIDSGEQDTQNTRESRTHSVGDEFTVGDVRYQVNGVTTTQEIGERTAGTLLGVEANGEFLLVDMTVMNEANEAITMRESSLDLMIDEAEYSTSSSAFAYMDDSFAFERLNPGVQVDGNVAYDVPESASTSSMELEVNPVGLFSTAEPHYVSLAQ